MPGDLNLDLGNIMEHIMIVDKQISMDSVDNKGLSVIIPSNFGPYIYIYTDVFI